MSRDHEERLADMHDACTRILDYVARGGDAWSRDPLYTDAIVRNLEILGEAAKHVPEEVRQLLPTIPWARVCGLRDVLIHRYFGIDALVLQDVVDRYIPPLAITLMAAMTDRGDGA